MRRKENVRGNQRKKKERALTECEGTVMMSRDGRVYVRIPDRADDVMIKSSRTRGALNGDRVKIVITRDGRKAEGEILTILERTKKPFVGVLHVVGAQAWVLMQSKYMPYDITVRVVDRDGKPLYRRRHAEENDPVDYTGALRQLSKNEYSVVGVTETVDGEDRELRTHIGMKVACIVDGWDRGEPNPRGHLVDVLGELGENDTEMHAILSE
jgi:ribonuclease R